MLCVSTTNKQYLLCYGAYVLEGQWLKVIVFEIVIEIDLKTLKDDADVPMVSEALVCMNKVELLTVHLAEPGQHIHLHLPLFRVRGQVLEDLHCNHFV